MEKVRQKGESVSQIPKDLGGTLTDLDVIKLCGCSRQSYYKYKAEIKNSI